MCLCGGGGGVVLSLLLFVLCCFVLFCVLCVCMYACMHVCNHVHVCMCSQPCQLRQWAKISSSQSIKSGNLKFCNDTKQYRKKTTSQCFVEAGSPPCGTHVGRIPDQHKEKKTRADTEAQRGRRTKGRRVGAGRS